ncbi:MAG: hypothetical protein L3J12_04850, partial [Spirochaetales bacterium]|nr:hypothetical protein [Spirochaetales bacterium]
MDSAYTVLYWNRALENLLNLSKKKVTGKNIFVFYPRINTNYVKLRLEQVFTKGMPVIFSNQLHGNLFHPVGEDKSYNRMDQHIIVTGMPAENSEEYLAVFNIKDISELSKKIKEYKTERKNTLIEIESRKKVEIVLKEALKDKEFLIKEVHHRVKNNLALIGSIIELQKQEIDSREFKSLLEDLNNRIRSISIIHEKLYKSSKNKFIDIHEYLTTLIGEIFNSMVIDTANIKIIYNIEKLVVKPETAIPLGLITTEIVTNSLKYGFREGSSGILTIYLTTGKEKTITFRISDNGPGFPWDMGKE